MKYLSIMIIAVASFSCSPKISPDSGWGRQRWVLVEMKAVPVQQSGGRKDAYINFEPDQKRFRGNGGCNQLTGNYSINKNEIRFTEVTSTKMSCEDIQFENTFISLLGTVNRYELRGDDLLLKRKRETVLILKAR